MAVLGGLPSTLGAVEFESIISYQFAFKKVLKDAFQQRGGWGDMRPTPPFAATRLSPALRRSTRLRVRPKPWGCGGIIPPLFLDY